MNLEYVSCNLCGADETTLLYPSTLKHVNKQQSKAYHCTNIGYGFHHAIVQCCKCGLVYANPRFPESELLAAYQEVVDPLYEQEREGRVLTFERHLKAIEELIGDYIIGENGFWMWEPILGCLWNWRESMAGMLMASNYRFGLLSYVTRKG